MLLHPPLTQPKKGENHMALTIDTENEMYLHNGKAYTFDYVWRKAHLLAVWLRENNRDTPKGWVSDDYSLYGEERLFCLLRDMIAAVEYFCAILNKHCGAMLHPQLLAFEGKHVAILFEGASKPALGELYRTNSRIPHHMLRGIDKKRGRPVKPWSVIRELYTV